MTNETDATTTEDGEATINYLSIDGKAPATVPVSLTVVDDEEIVMEAHDDTDSEPVRFLVAENGEGTISLHTHNGQTVNGNRMTRPAFPRDDGQTIKLSWKHDDEHVKNVELDDHLFAAIGGMIETARGAQDHSTVAEASAETGVEIPAIPLVVEETSYRTAGWDGMTTTTKLTVVPAESAEGADWDTWSEAFCEAGDYHTTHVSTDHHILPPEDSDYEAGDTLTLHDLIDEWHCVAADVIDGADEIEKSRERSDAIESVHEAHPELRGLSFDAEEVDVEFDEAAATGERVAVATGGSECNDPGRECSWDRITAFATPDGAVERERTHTY